MIYLIRDRGRLRVEQDLHTLGLFPLATWERLLSRAGFETRRIRTTHGDDPRQPYLLVGKAI